MAGQTHVYVTVVLDVNPQQVYNQFLKPYYNVNGVLGLANMLQALGTGQLQGKVIYAADEADGTAAAQTVACTQANADAGDTVTIAGVVFTVAASPSSDPADGQFAAGASDTAMGDNLAAAINAHPAIVDMASAANSTGTVTITFRDKGIFANQGALATSDATAFTLGAANFASGAVGTSLKELTCFERGLR